MECKNCKTALHEQSEYCHKCGGKIIRKRLSFKNLFEHLSETFFNYDNKLLRTFTKLFTDPEDVIMGYIKGVRKRYINPISFFGLALTLSGLSIFILQKFYSDSLVFPETFKNSNMSEDVFNKLFENISEYNSLFYSALVPLFAIISLIIFLDKKYNFTEHLIIYLYSMSLLSILMVFLGQIILFVSPSSYFSYGLFTWVLMFAYHCYALKKVFKLSLGNLALRSFLALTLFFIAYMGISIIVFVILITTGTVSLEDFAPK